ncbi:MAG: 4Fe-4S binding protein [Clostridia bacterium]|nr:4Fe-4S binding protein [Clostridia bacterium]
MTKKGRNGITLVLNEQWCKGCGICVFLCPQGVLRLKQGKAFVYEKDACIGCRNCELHCPDFAILVGGETS